MAETQLLDAYDRVLLARKPERPNVRDYIENLFTGFIELHGDRCAGDDGALIGGVAFLGEIPVTVLGHKKGRGLEENLACNFGMPNPEGYRKALRLMLQAEKFGRPVISFVDTSGAYPGLEAEERGQGEAIARCLMESARLTVPMISVVTGEGGSGGALALSVANRVWMLENAVYSVLSPEGFAAILWKDSGRAREAARTMKLTATDLLAAGVADEVFPEPPLLCQGNAAPLYKALSRRLRAELALLKKTGKGALVQQRCDKFRAIGNWEPKSGLIV